MKIGLFFGYAPPEIGAPVTRARSLARFLNEDRGYETVAFAPSRERDQGFHDGVYRYSDRHDLAAGIRQMKLDGAVVSSPPLDIARWSAKELKKQGIPFTADIRDPAVTQIWSTPGGRAGKFLKSFKAWLKEELLIRDAESAVAVSQYLRDQTQRNHPTSARKMSVAANGADLVDILRPRKLHLSTHPSIVKTIPGDDRIPCRTGSCNSGSCPSRDTYCASRIGGVSRKVSPTIGPREVMSRIDVNIVESRVEVPIRHCIDRGDASNVMHRVQEASSQIGKIRILCACRNWVILSSGS